MHGNKICLTQKGYDLLDEDPGFGVSQFREFNNHRRSVEGELARSIMAIKAVQSARVILAQPKSTTFLRDRRRPSASVHVSIKSGRVLTNDKVRGIMNLVAAGVPELRPEHVVVVDQAGNLLSKGADDAGSAFNLTVPVEKGEGTIDLRDDQIFESLTACLNNKIDI